MVPNNQFIWPLIGFFLTPLGACKSDTVATENPSPVAVPTSVPTTVPTTPATPDSDPVASSASSVPDNAVLVEATKRAALQAELDRNKVIYLEAKDYAYPNKQDGTPPNSWGGAYPALRLSSGQQIYGYPGTTIPHIVIEPGSSGIVLRGLIAEKITFPSSALVTKGNLFQKLRYTALYCTGCTLESNAFYDLSWTGIDFDFTAGGYLRNNRFTRTLIQGGHPQIKLWGHASRSSYGNTFVFVNFLTPSNGAVAPVKAYGDATDLKNFDDFTIVGFDAESYEQGHAFLHTGAMGSLRIFGAEGLNAHRPNPNGEPVPAEANSGVLDSNADEVVFLDDSTGAFGTPQIILREKNKTYFEVNSVQNWLYRDLAVSPSARFRVFGNVPAFNTPAPEKLMQVDGASKLQELSAAQKSKLPAILYDDAVGARLRPWPVPIFAPIADPLGANWQATAATCVDVSDKLQAQLDATKVIRLPAGTYCIGKSLKLQLGGGIIGAGMGKTIMLAKNPNIDILVPNNWPSNFFGDLTLLDLTMQGGRSALRIDETHVQPGGGGILNGLNVGYVTFRNFSSAALYFTGIFGFDNNFLDNLNFVNNKYGLYTASLVLPGSPTEAQRLAVATYMDKTVFHHSQFVGNEIGVYVTGYRANNLILFSDSSFRDNVQYSVNIANCSRLTFTNSDLVNNGGNPTIDGNASIYIVNSRFVGGPLTASMLGGKRNSWIGVEGSTFARGTANAAASIFTDGAVVPCNGCDPRDRRLNAPGFVGFYNSQTADMPLGGPVEYLGINSQVPLNPELNKKMVMVSGKTRFGAPPVTYVYDSAAPHAAPRLLTTRP